MSPLTATTFEEARKYFGSDQDQLSHDIETITKLVETNHTISDFSFLVAPLSKAYEGYLKDFFLELNVIDQYSYDSDRFRVGKTLNPSLRYKRFSIFQKLSDLDDTGEELAELLWDAWKYGRNEIFHYFPGSVKKISFDEAENRINLILTAVIKSGQFLENHSERNGLL